MFGIRSSCVNQNETRKCKHLEHMTIGFWNDIHKYKGTNIRNQASRVTFGNNLLKFATTFSDLPHPLGNARTFECILISYSSLFIFPLTHDVHSIRLFFAMMQLILEHTIVHTLSYWYCFELLKLWHIRKAPVPKMVRQEEWRQVNGWRVPRFIRWHYAPFLLRRVSPAL